MSFTLLEVNHGKLSEKDNFGFILGSTIIVSSLVTLAIVAKINDNNINKSMYYPTDKPSYYSSDNHIVLVPKDETIYVCADDYIINDKYNLYRHNLATDSDNDGYYDYEFIEGDKGCIKINTEDEKDLEFADEILKQAGQQPLQRKRIKNNL